jgi:hypothetical protein
MLSLSASLNVLIVPPVVYCRFGTVLENVQYDPVTREVNYDDG